MILIIISALISSAVMILLMPINIKKLNKIAIDKELNKISEKYPDNIEICKEILKKIDFTEEEKNIIIKSIQNHRKEADDELSLIIYRSDKLSRECFNCKAINDCYWSDEKKNLKINY